MEGKKAPSRKHCLVEDKFAEKMKEYNSQYLLLVKSVPRPKCGQAHTTTTCRFPNPFLSIDGDKFWNPMPTLILWQWKVPTTYWKVRALQTCSPHANSFYACSNNDTPSGAL
ncbi:hypothetical protein VNO77_40846 [Canavalia gladiata]|uniref:Uncharacterized protein n=1 Tax=Canavalia gladiata TaxID=3824 RepID=A0AAN9K062_CANGL